MTAPAPSDSAPVANRDAAVSSEYKSQPSAATPKGTYAFVSLGCPKNLVDSEKMLGTLALDGYTLVAEPDGADGEDTCNSRAEVRAGPHEARFILSSPSRMKTRIKTW